MTGHRYYLILLIFSIFFTLFGLVFTFIPASDLRTAFKAGGWTITEGTITKSEIHIAGGKTANYFPFVQYSYHVNNRDYFSSKIAFSHFTEGKDGAEEIVSKYPVDSKAQVYFSPENPEKSVLDNKVQYSENIVGIIVGLLLSITGLILIFFSVKHVRKSKIISWTPNKDYPNR